MSNNIVPFRGKKNRTAPQMRSAFEDLAQQFLDRNIAVFPIAEDAKVPLTKHGFKEASDDPTQIRKWGTRFPDANIGVPTGKISNLVVVDLDKKNGKDGVAAFRKLCKELGIKIPKTYKLQTPSGGRHLYFKSKFAGEIINSVSALGDGIDVRASGGYVVGERSEIDGNRYSCISGNLDSITRLPPALRKAMQGRTNAKTQDNRGDSIPQGTRNSKLFRTAVSLREIGRNRRATLALIRLINRADCKPPLDNKELERLVDSAFDNETSEIKMDCASDIEPMPLSPLWPGVLFKRKVALLAGEPGLGKSLFCCDVAARISRAAKWPGR